MRNGQNQDNITGVVTGQRHTTLTVLGHHQAQAAAGLLRDAQASYLFSSDRRSARMTASIIGEALGLPVVDDPDLRDRAAGSVEGKALGGVPVPTPPEGVHLHDVQLGGGESLVDLYARVARFFDRVAALPPGDVIVVSHATWIQVAEAFLAGAGPYEIEWGDVPNGSVRVRWLRSAPPEPGR